MAARPEPDDPLEELLAAERALRTRAAARLRRIDDVRRRWETDRGANWSLSRQNLQGRALRAEVATLLTIPEPTAEALLARAELLVHDVPTTLARLEEGRLTERNAMLLAEAAAPLDPEGRTVLEARALPYAESLTATKFARKVAVLRELIRPSEATRRHREAFAQREIRIEPDRDGMAWVHAHIRLASAAGIDDYVDRIARLDALDGDERSHTQRRADAFVDLLLDGGVLLPSGDGKAELREPTKRPRGIVPTVNLTVPALTVAGTSDEPGTLGTLGPIDPETARELVGCAPGLYRVLTDPGTGVMLQYGRERYRVPKQLRRYLQLRDGTCRFPGCNRQAVRCDVDHCDSWENLGETEAGNLAHLCRGHHRLKHGTDWAVKQDPGAAVLTWTSPEGRNYGTEPAMAPPTASPPPRRGPSQPADDGEWAAGGAEIPPF
ncbi:MAG: endonuclease [Naasia sp.]|nr:endonuclease [Naasia sp.]